MVGLGDLITALDTQILTLKAERNTVIRIKSVGDSRAVKEAREAKAQQLLEWKEDYEKLRVAVVAELASLKKSVAAAEAAEAKPAECMDVQEDVISEDSYGADAVEDEEMAEEGVSITDEEMAATKGLITSPDGTKRSARARKLPTKLADNLGANKPKCKKKGARFADKDEGLMVEQAESIIQKEQREAARVEGAAVEASDE